MIILMDQCSILIPGSFPLNDVQHEQPTQLRQSKIYVIVVLRRKLMWYLAVYSFMD